MASILPIGSRWRAQVRRSGGKSISKTFATKRAAEVWAREIETELDRGGKAEVLTVRLGELILKYREARTEWGRPVIDKSNEDSILDRLHDTFQSDFAAKLTTDRIATFAQLRRKAGAGGYNVDMDISKLGTVMRHMASLLGIMLPDAIAAVRPSLRHLGLVESGKRRTAPVDRRDREDF